MVNTRLQAAAVLKQAASACFVGDDRAGGDDRGVGRITASSLAPLSWRVSARVLLLSVDDVGDGGGKGCDISDNHYSSSSSSSSSSSNLAPYNQASLVLVCRLLWPPLAVGTMCPILISIRTLAVLLTNTN